MTRTAVACPEDDGKPRRKPPGRVPAWKISPMSLERAQTCIRAAELRARSTSWKDIAAELGIEDWQKVRSVVGKLKGDPARLEAALRQ